MRAARATKVSSRVELLIARHHGGDRDAAAKALGIEPECLAGLLSGDWRRFSLDAMAAVVRLHRVSAQWLLESAPARNHRSSPTTRSES